MNQQQEKLDFDESAVEEGFSSAEESKDVEESLKYSRDENNEFSMDDSPDMGMGNRKKCEVDESDKNIVAEDNSSNKNIVAEDKLISDKPKSMDCKIARKESRKDSDVENVDKTTNNENTDEKVHKIMKSGNTVGNVDKTTNSNNTVKKVDKTTDSKATAKNLDKTKKDKKSNTRNKQKGKAKDLESSKDNKNKGKLTNLEKSKKTEDKNVQKKKHISNEKKLKEEKTEPAAMQGIPKEKKKQKSSTDNKISKDKTSGQGTKERRRSSFTENTQKDTVRDLPKKIVTKLSKKRERKIKGVIYTESLNEEIKLKLRNESRDTRSSLVLLEDPILEESEEEDNVENMRSSSKLTPITRVIITPRLEGGFSHNPPFNMSDPRNGRFSRDSEDDRHSINTDFYTPDLNSRDDVFSDFEDDLDTSNFKPEKKKKKKTKKMKRLEKKEKAKKRKAKLLYEKIRGFCDSLYESESLTISIKRERKLKLDTFLPARLENRQYRIKRRKLASLIKKMQQTLDTFKKKQQDIQENLKRLEGKKDKDAKPIMETLYEQLMETEQLYQQALGELKEVQDDLGKKLGKREDKPTQEVSRSGGSNSRKAHLSPDEQELTYELKAQLMRNIEMQNQKLKTELTLHEKMNESKMLNQQNKKLHDDSSMSRTNTLRLMKMFEKKAKDADEKLKEMQRELHKSQQLTKKYQQLLELERRKMGGGSGHVTPVSTGDEGDSPRVPHPSSYSLLGGNVRVNDIIRKNEVLVEENGNLKREIQRLKQDNATLIKKTKHAMTDKDEIIKRIQTLYAENAKMHSQLSKERSQHRLETSNMRNRTLSRDLTREKSQHNMLARSLTRQASDWIMLKKQLAQFDEEYKWSQVGPVNPTGAEERTYQHHAPKNVYMPRKMYPVENYAQTKHGET